MNKNIYLFGSINDDLANNIIKELIETNKNEYKNINLYINSGGGSIVNAFAICSVINNIEINVTTICLGRAASAAAIVMLSGNKRKMYNNSFIMIHNLSVDSSGLLSSIHNDYLHMIKLKNTMINIIINNSTCNKEFVEEQIINDWWINCNKALDLNMIDEIIN